MGLRFAASGVLIVAGLLMILLDTHFGKLRAWDRPGWSLARWYRWSWRPVAWMAVLSGVLLASVVSPVVGLACAAILSMSWGWMRWVRSAGYVARRLSTEMSALRARAPELTERDLLRAVILARHPRWGEELAEQIVAEHPDVRGVAGVLVRMGRNLSGPLPRVRR